jgi:hypothetical protein
MGNKKVLPMYQQDLIFVLFISGLFLFGQQYDLN